MTDADNPGVEGSEPAVLRLVPPKPEELLTQRLETALVEAEVDDSDGGAWNLAVDLLRIVREWDAEQRRRQRLTGPVINVVMDPPRPVVVTEVYERHPDGTMRRIR